MDRSVETANHGRSGASLDSNDFSVLETRWIFNLKIQKLEASIVGHLFGY